MLIIAGALVGSGDAGTQASEGNTQAAAIHCCMDLDNSMSAVNSLHVFLPSHRRLDRPCTKNSSSSHQQLPSSVRPASGAGAPVLGCSSWVGATVSHLIEQVAVRGILFLYWYTPCSFSRMGSWHSMAELSSCMIVCSIYDCMCFVT